MNERLKIIFKFIKTDPKGLCPFIALIVCSATYGVVPTWLIVVSLIPLALKFIVTPRYHKIVKNLLYFPPPLLTYLEFKTILNIEAGITFLVLIQGLKYFEARSRRDYFAHLNILILILAGQILFTQSLYAFVITLLSLMLILYGMLILEGLHFTNSLPTMKKFLKDGKVYIISGLMLSAFMFVLFPRYEAGLFSRSRTIGQSGFSPQAKISDVSEIQLSDTVVFRAQFFDGVIPPMNDLYWVGTVLWETDGLDWRQGFVSPPQLREPKRSKDAIYAYEIQSESMITDYLFSLDSPVAYPQLDIPFDYRLDKTFRLKRANSKKVRYTMKSSTTYKRTKVHKFEPRFGVKLHNGLKRGRLLSLAKSLKAASNEQTVQNILNYFKKGNFRYTLKPGPIKSITDFLFVQRKGFCTHFASAFSILARLTGVPSRLVVGYQGGNVNTYGNYVIVKEKDAHAWSEYYQKDKGWTRIDPVEVVQPERIRYGGQEFFDNILTEDGTAITGQSHLSQFQLLYDVKQFLDNMNMQWSNFVYGFDQDYQKKIAELLATDLTNLYRIALLIPVFFIIFLAFLQFRANQTKKNKDKLSDLFLKLERKLPDNFARPLNCDPVVFLDEVIKSKELGQEIEQQLENFREIYRNTAYGRDSNSIELREKSIKKLSEINKLLIKKLKYAKNHPANKNS